MFFPTQDAIKRAAQAQQGSIHDERDSPTHADDRAVAVATVHTRQDLILLTSLTADCHRQLVKISQAAWIAVFLLFAIASILGERA